MTIKPDKYIIDRRIPAWYKKIPIKNKLISLFTLFIIISVMFVYFLSSMIYTQVIKKQLYEFSRDTLMNKSFVMDYKLKQYDALSMQIFSNQEFRKLLQFTDRNSYEDVLNQNHFTSIINSLVSQSNIGDIVYLSISSPYGKYWIGDSNSELIGYDFKFYPQIKAANGRMVITNTEKSKLTNNMSCFCICRLIRDDSGQELGYLMIMIKENFFKNMVENLNLGKESLLYVISQDGSIMFANADSQDYTEIIRSNFKKYRDDDFSIIKDINHENYLITSYKSSYTGWTLVNFVPMTYFFKGERTYRQITVLACILFIVLSIIASVTFSNNISRPIGSLIATMREISNGNLSRRSENVQSPEMSELSEHFNNMIDQINGLMLLNENKQKEAAKIELAMLQAQINPHFLYNTLNTIRWISIINQQDQIKNLVDSLSKLLINTFRTSQEIITLESELDLLQNYTTIMMVRYNTFVLQIEIEPDVKLCMIQKFILQPFVENSIIHGFREIKCLGIIQIKAYKDSGHLVIRVKDNGKGINEVEISRLSGDMTHGKTTSGNIGIYNVQRRIKLRYGDAFGISINKDLSVGTEIEIRLPIEYDEAAHA